MTVLGFKMSHPFFFKDFLKISQKGFQGIEQCPAADSDIVRVFTYFELFWKIICDTIRSGRDMAHVD